MAAENRITYHEPDKIWKKDPNEIQAFSIDWTNWLKGDTISASNWYMDEGTPSGISLSSSANTTTGTSTNVSSGYHGGRYVLTNQITTAAGLKQEKKVIIHVLDTEYRRMCN